MSLKNVLIKLAEVPEGWLSVNVPNDLKARLRLMHRYVRPDDLAEEGLDKKPHITLAYGLSHGLQQDQIKKLLQLPRGAKIRIGGMSIFNNKDSDVLKFDVESDDLNRMHKQIESEIGLPGKTYKGYKPHITVAYLKKGTKLDKYKALEKMLIGKEFNADKIALRLGEARYE